jgi:hypothetical protein
MLEEFYKILKIKFIILFFMLAIAFLTVSAKTGAETQNSIPPLDSSSLGTPGLMFDPFKLSSRRYYSLPSSRFYREIISSETMVVFSSSYTRIPSRPQLRSPFRPPLPW